VYGGCQKGLVISIACGIGDVGERMELYLGRIAVRPIALRVEWSIIHDFVFVAPCTFRALTLDNLQQ
jgi:hypothetical protein